MTACYGARYSRRLAARNSGQFNSIPAGLLPYTDPMKRTLVGLLIFTVFVETFAQTGSRMKSNQALPTGYWPLERSQPIIDKTQTIRLAPELAKLSEGERKTVAN